jgi:hypothetical protein
LPQYEHVRFGFCALVANWFSLQNWLQTVSQEFNVSAATVNLNPEKICKLFLLPIENVLHKPRLDETINCVANCFQSGAQPMRQDQISKRLRDMAAELAAIADQLAGEISGPSEDVKQEVQAKMDRRECLVCGRTVPEDEQVSMGLGKRCCYFDVRRKIKEGVLRLDDLVAAGKYAPEAKPGGRPSKNTAIAELVEQLRDDKQPAKPKPKRR